MKRKLRMGMVGGGKDAFIGAIHRLAANMDGLIELSCGALSINPEIAKDSAKDLFLPEDRTYLTYDEMITKESALPEYKRIDFVTIVTPNFAHFAPAMMALENGFNVVIEKPMTFTLDEAKQLKKKVEQTGLRLCLTHTYSGYPGTRPILFQPFHHVNKPPACGSSYHPIVQPVLFYRQPVQSPLNTLCLLLWLFVFYQCGGKEKVPADPKR